MISIIFPNPNSSYTKDRIQIYVNVIDIGHAKFSYMNFIDFLVILTKVKMYVKKSMSYDTYMVA